MGKIVARGRILHVEKIKSLNQFLLSSRARTIQVISLILARLLVLLGFPVPELDLPFTTSELLVRSFLPYIHVEGIALIK
jgi:hypothetical protein